MFSTRACSSNSAPPKVLMLVAQVRTLLSSWWSRRTPKEDLIPWAFTNAHTFTSPKMSHGSKSWLVIFLIMKSIRVGTEQTITLYRIWRSSSCSTQLMWFAHFSRLPEPTMKAASHSASYTDWLHRSLLSLSTLLWSSTQSTRTEWSLEDRTTATVTRLLRDGFDLKCEFSCSGLLLAQSSLLVRVSSDYRASGSSRKKAWSCKPSGGPRTPWITFITCKLSRRIST